MIFKQGEWPTQEKIERLREAGYVPHAPKATRLLVWSAVLCLILFWEGELSRFMVQFAQVFKTPEARLPVFGEMIRELLEPLIVTNLAIVALILLAGLLQTSFFIRPGLVCFDFARLVQNNRAPFLWRVATSLVVLVAAVVLMALGMRLGWFRVLSVLTVVPPARPGDLAEELRIALPGMAMCLLLLGFISGIAGRFLFFSSHRMSKDEIEAEMRGGSSTV